MFKNILSGDEELTEESYDAMMKEWMSNLSRRTITRILMIEKDTGQRSIQTNVQFNGGAYIALTNVDIRFVLGSIRSRVLFLGYTNVFGGDNLDEYIKMLTNTTNPRILGERTKFTAWSRWMRTGVSMIFSLMSAVREDPGDEGLRRQAAGARASPRGE